LQQRRGFCKLPLQPLQQQQRQQRRHSHGAPVAWEVWARKTDYELHHLSSQTNEVFTRSRKSVSSMRTPTYYR
jgi:hypothetical protein